MRVFIAQHADQARDSLVAEIAAAGYLPVCAADLDGVLAELSADDPPLLVVLDLAMPGLTVESLLGELRSAAAGRPLYIVVVTDEGADEDAAAVYEAGADDFVTRPVDARRLLARLRAGARIAGLEQRLAAEREHFAQANRQLERAALLDPLTGLPNRRYLDQRLLHEWKVAAQSDAPLACILVDVDRFKLINDTHGHAAGDRVLCRVATLLKSAAADDDAVCRIGGEEFLVVCPGAGLDEALARAEQMRRAIADEMIDVQAEPPRSVTISAGVAVKDDTTANPAALIRAADAALYQAKRAGRNCVRAK